MAEYRYEQFRLAEAWPTWQAVGDSRYAEEPGVLAVFRAEIGVASDEGVVLSTADADGTSKYGVAHLHADALVPTLRPEQPQTITDTGVYAHRRFEVAEGDWEEFLALSAAAWPGFEEVNEGCRIHGLWRVPTATVEHGVVEALLITRYPSLAAWEKSRPYASQPADEDKLESWIAARDAFRRRAELTRRTVVRTYRLV